MAPSALKADVGIVARVPLAGAELVEGDLIATASGRPVFLLVGEQPVFRDLGPGLEGEDVRQLQDGLRRLGLYAGPVDGTYGDETEAAVAAWYEAAGFKPFTTTDDQLASIRALEKELISVRLDILGTRESIAAAEEALASARAANALAAVAVQGGAGAEAAARAEAAAANQAANAELATKQATLDGLLGLTPVSPASQAEIAVAQAELAAAQATAETVRLAGQTSVMDAQANYDAAAAELAALQADPSSTPEQIAAAQAAVASAQASLSAAQAEAAAANQAATADVAVKQAALNLASGQPPTAAEIAAARADVATAQATVESTRLAGEKLIADAMFGAASSTTDTALSEAAMQAARSAISLGSQAISERKRMSELISVDLGLAQRRAGVQVPADEIIFVTSAPVRVAELVLGRGGQLSGPIMKVTDATVLVDGSLPLEMATLVQDGMQVFIDEPDLGIEASGVVSRVAEIPGTNGVDGFHVYFETLVNNPPPTLVGASVRLTVPVESTETNVLAVPVNALFLGVDGSSQVQRQRDGMLEVVKVEPGLSADGFVEVRPLAAGTLKVGDLVLIGYEQAAPVVSG
ncbi:MAG: peptidoglycan-binding protein [Acidimicrobiia bacterium]